MSAIDDILNESIASPPQTRSEVRQFVSKVLSASDVTTLEKDAFEAGYICGLSYALVAKGDMADMATELMLRMQEADA